MNIIANFAVATTAAAQLISSPAPASIDTLVVFEDSSCSYCIEWEREVGTVFPKTDEAQRVSLVRVDASKPRPRELHWIKDIHYYPTFVVVHCGREFRRITGYPGADQFWGLFDEAIRSMKDAPCPERSY